MNFEYTVNFGEYSKEVEFQIEITTGGFDHDWNNGGRESYPEIDDIRFSEQDLTQEEITYINKNIIDSEEFHQEIWNRHEDS